MLIDLLFSYFVNHVVFNVVQYVFSVGCVIILHHIFTEVYLAHTSPYNCCKIASFIHTHTHIV